MKHMLSLLLLLLLNLLDPVISYWLYTWPEGKCPSFQTCQDCVVETAYTSDGAGSRPCTWCQDKGTCEMMNHYTGRCSKGATYRTTCPIKTADMPKCVYFQYSFWFSYNTAPGNRNECHQTYVDKNKPTRLANDKIVKVCNGDVKNFESLHNVGWASALSLSKDVNGLEVQMNYVWDTYSDITRNKRDRRRIITEVDPIDDSSFNWLCQAFRHTVGMQSTLMKYRVTQEDPTIRVSSSSVSGDDGPVLFGLSGDKNAGFTPVLFAAMMLLAFVVQ